MTATAESPDGIAIAINQVKKTYGSGASAFTALKGANLNIKHNEFFTLLGPSGCGKTTLLRLIAGFEAVTEGEISLYGEEIAHLPPDGRPVNTVFQHYALFPHMTVAENIAFGLQRLKKPDAEVQKTVSEMLALVHLEAFADRKPHQMSGGQMQRVALARALAPHPKVLLLDEPLSALDLKLRQAMRDELQRLQRETGITFLFVTHDQEEALAMSDRIAVMANGIIQQVGSPTEIYMKPKNKFVADFIGESNFIDVNIAEVKGGQTTIQLSDGGRISVKMSDKLRAGVSHTISIRPENIVLVPDAGNLYQGKIIHKTYLGSASNYTVELSDGQTLDARRNNRLGRVDAINMGDMVGIEFAEDSIAVMTE